MKATRFWIVLFSAVLIVAAAAVFFISSRRPGGAVANVYQNGVKIRSIELSDVTEAYTFVVEGSVENTVAVEHGRICVLSATCPDQICVKQGWLYGGAVPIVCLPNSLVIEIETADGDVDGVLR